MANIVNINKKPIDEKFLAEFDNVIKHVEVDKKRMEQFYDDLEAQYDNVMAQGDVTLLIKVQSTLVQYAEYIAGKRSQLKELEAQRTMYMETGEIEER